MREALELRIAIGAMGGRGMLDRTHSTDVGDVQLPENRGPATVLPSVGLGMPSDFTVDGEELVDRVVKAAAAEVDRVTQAAKAEWEVLGRELRELCGRLADDISEQ